MCMLLLFPDLIVKLRPNLEEAPDGYLTGLLWFRNQLWSHLKEKVSLKITSRSSIDFVMFCFQFQVYAFEEIVDGKEVAYYGRYTNPAPIYFLTTPYPVYETDNCVGLHHTGRFDSTSLIKRSGIALQSCVGERFVCLGE